jgi:hypothetical protein
MDFDNLLSLDSRFRGNDRVVKLASTTAKILSVLPDPPWRTCPPVEGGMTYKVIHSCTL